MAKRDYYDVLEIDRSAGEAEIKRAYRRLALRWHPDRNPSDAGAEARFKELAEAYQVLSDPGRRAEYDRFGHRAVFQERRGGAADFDLRTHVDDLFSEIFGDVFGHRRHRGPRPERGQDLRYNLTLDFREAVFGCTRDIEIPVLRDCAECRGSGARRGTAPAPCPECHGQGRARFQQGFFSVERECPRCRGEGRVASDPCPACGGRGIAQQRRRLSIAVPAGVDEGTRLRVSGEGERGSHGGPPGDLYVVLSVRPHPLFRRQGEDLVCEVPVSLVQAVLGGELEMPTLEESVAVRVPPGTQPGAVLTLKGHGIPTGRGARRGDLRIVVQVEIPAKVTAKQEKLLREFERLGAPKRKTAAERSRKAARKPAG